MILRTPERVLAQDGGSWSRPVLCEAALIATDDGCRLEVWVRGDLNFEWEIEFEVDPGARTSHSLSDSYYVAVALYTAILDRDPDQQRQQGAVAEVQQRNLEDLINAMLRSLELAESRNDVPPEDLLDRFYLGIFDRRADTGRLREYLKLVRSGRYVDTLLRMIRSPQFKRRLPGSTPRD